MKKQSFEEMLAELEETIARLGDEDTPLEEALALYAKAAQKISACSRVLEEARVQVEEIGKTLAPNAEGEDNEGV